MKFILLLTIMTSFGACKTPNSANSGVKAQGAVDPATGKACLAWIKDGSVLYKSCDLESECTPEGGYAVMSEELYINKLNATYGISDKIKDELSSRVIELEEKMMNHAKVRNQIIENKTNNPNGYEVEIKKIDDLIFTTGLALEEAKAYDNSVAERQASAQKILKSLRNLKTRRLDFTSVPDIADTLTPLFGKDLSNCFDRYRSPTFYELIDDWNNKIRRWNNYQSWKQENGPPPA